MSDFKSKLPDLKELGEISCKLFKDLKTSVSEIITTYKQKHPSDSEKQPKKTASTEKKSAPVTNEAAKKPKVSEKTTSAAKKDDK